MEPPFLTSMPRTSFTYINAKLESINIWQGLVSFRLHALNNWWVGNNIFMSLFDFLRELSSFCTLQVQRNNYNTLMMNKIYGTICYYFIIFTVNDTVHSLWTTHGIMIYWLWTTHGITIYSLWTTHGITIYSPQTMQGTITDKPESQNLIKTLTMAVIQCRRPSIKSNIFSSGMYISIYLYQQN